MDAFVARQPIFDRSLRLQGYELLCSSDDRSRVGALPPDSSRVFATTLHRVGLERLTGGRLAFVGFSRDLLVEGYALLLPPERIVVGVAGEVAGDPDVVAACDRLKSAGYRLSLRAPACPRHLRPLREVADILRVDLAATAAHTRHMVVREAGGCTLLASGVDTTGEFEAARAGGFHLFQGLFFQKPVRAGEVGIGRDTSRTLELLQVLGDPELDLGRVERLVRADLSLCYRLLRYLNSAAFGWRAHIESVGHALVLLGDDGVRRWLWLSALGELSAERPDELVTASAVRAWLCESLGAVAGADATPLLLFLTGMLSLLDAILGRSMPDVLDEVACPGPVRRALLDRTGPAGEVLRVVEAAERADWPGLRSGLQALGLSELAAANCYREALSAADALSSA